MTTALATRQAQAVTTMIEDFDTALIVRDVQPEVVEKWGYSFPMKGEAKPVEGLSVLGVQAAVRWSSKNGEPISTIDCHMEYEDEDEARFVATAVRYAIIVRDGSDPQRVELDRTIRAKRQPKWGITRDGQSRYYIDNWFEIGYSKACRNAENALLTDQAKSAILAAARQARDALKGGRPQQERPKPDVARNEIINALNAHLMKIRDSFPDLYPTVRDQLKARYPKALQANGAFVASKLTVEELPEARQLVADALEKANGGPGPQASLLAKAEKPEAETACVECGSVDVVLFDAEANGYCAEHVPAESSD